jgi:hypothetical protein
MTRRSIGLVTAGLLLSLTAAVAQQNEQDEAQKAQRLETGRITKIDTKKRILTVHTETAPSSTPQPQQPARTGGGSRGGRGRGGVNFPGGSRPTSTSNKDQGKEFKAVVTEKTTIKDGESNISFLTLSVGDHISIQGQPKGNSDDLNATQIKLVHQDDGGRR